MVAFWYEGGGSTFIIRWMNLPNLLDLKTDLNSKLENGYSLLRCT